MLVSLGTNKILPLRVSLGLTNTMTCLKKIKAFCKKIATPGQGSGLAENKNSIDNYDTHGHGNIRAIYTRKNKTRLT